MEETARTRAEMISKVITKIFWRILLLIAVAAFAYGLGSSLPREMREYLNFLRKGEKKEISKDKDR